MTTPTPDSSELVASAQATAGTRIAAILCWVVGSVTVLASFASALPVRWMVVNAVAGLLVCVAGVLVRKQLRAGAYLVALGWAFPSLVSLATGGGARPGPLLLLVAGIALLANWKYLR